MGHPRVSLGKTWAILSNASLTSISWSQQSVIVKKKLKKLFLAKNISVIQLKKRILLFVDSSSFEGKSVDDFCQTPQVEGCL